MESEYWVRGGVSERLKEADCKSVGYAYVGSNPTPSTRKMCGISLMVKQQISNLRSRVRFSYPAPEFAALDFAHVAQW